MHLLLIGRKKRFFNPDNIPRIEKNSNNNKTDIYFLRINYTKIIINRFSVGYLYIGMS